MTDTPEPNEARVELWRCPTHGLIEPKVIDNEWPAEPRDRKAAEDYGPDDHLCPVPCYDESPCEEPLTPVTLYATREGESRVPAEAIREAMADCEGIDNQHRYHALCAKLLSRISAYGPCHDHTVSEPCTPTCPVYDPELGGGGADDAEDDGEEQ